MAFSIIECVVVACYAQHASISLALPACFSRLSACAWLAHDLAYLII